MKTDKPYKANIQANESLPMQFFQVVGLIIILCNKHKQRLGDFCAQTYVVRS